MKSLIPPGTSPPRAASRPQPLEAVHGRTRTDPYAWLRAANWQEVMRDPSKLDAEIRAYLEAENAYAAAAMASTEGLQDRLFREYRGRIEEDESSVPADDGPWSYYLRYAVGAQHPVFCRTPRGAAEPETVLFDGEEASRDKPYFEVASCEPSPDHTCVGVATDESGAELWTLRFRNPRNGDWHPDRIEETGGSFVFADETTVFYTVLDAEHRPRTVKRHRLGDDPAYDQVVYHEPDPGFFVGLSRTESGRFVIIDAHDHETSEVRLLETAAPESEPIVVAARQTQVEYDVSHRGDDLIIKTNADGAEDYSMVRMPVSALGSGMGRGSWVALVPHRLGHLILDFQVFARYLVLHERVDGLPRLVVYAFDEQPTQPHVIAFDEDAYSLSLMGSREYDTSVVRLSYSSMTTPRQVFDYDMNSRERTLRKTQQVPSGHNPDQYKSHRLMVKSHDGEEVPVSVLHHVSTPLDGTAPLLLYGYGAYGHAIPASFEVTRLSLVDRGFVFAIAHVRGGMERGYRWYRAGKLDKKENSFLDFIAAAEALVELGWVDPHLRAAQGGSAGGLLMGAVLNRRPELFHAVVADVPFVDVLNTMLDASLPLTPPEWPEWGDPASDVDAFERLLAYSPYDNVQALEYPHLLVLAGLADPRVTYWEPAKWVARLREMKRGDRLLVLKTHMDAGHGGASGRFDSLRDVALEHAFLLRMLGRDETEPFSSMKPARP